jgi:hypothetical protein
MEKRVIIDQITIDVKNGGHRLYRFCKQIVDDDGTVLSEQYHRTAVAPDGDDDAQMEIVNTHLRDGMKVGEIVAEDRALVVDLAAAIAKVNKKAGRV